MNMSDGSTTSVGRATVLMAAAAATLAVAASACAGSGDDKAGGSSRGKPVLLTLVLDSGVDSDEFVKAVERLSSGSVRIDVTESWRRGQLDREARTIEDVRAGRFDLALVGARAWDTLGVTSFQALLAPFLVDSYALQRRVLQSGLAQRMLTGVEPLGLVGVALLPGPLRRPLGVSRALGQPVDYEGATVGVGPGWVARTTFRALGARPLGFVAPLKYDPALISAFDGAELEFTAILGLGYDVPSRAVTANVAFWPRAQTIVASRKTFAALAPAQKRVLRRAAADAVAAESARIEAEEETLLATRCAQVEIPFAIASNADRAALRGAVQPVYHVLERDALTRELIAEIRTLRTTVHAVQGQPLRCRRTTWDPLAGRSKLDGAWRVTLSRDELIGAGLTRQVAEGCRPCSFTLELDGGRFFADLGARYFWSGRYAVEGRVFHVFLRACSPDPCGPLDYDVTWSLYRDTLSFSRIRGGLSWQPALLVADSFSRVR
jgi:TRAP-type C4-dicarboxylate transport system substrate-binding protein